MKLDVVCDTKAFVKRAVAVGRERQSSLTGFVHYAFEDPESRDTIPVYENMLFALALCRTNQADHILEGRDIVLKLYPYFEISGAFGIYLHEWPEIRKPLANVRILFPLLHIYRDYLHVMGDEARDKVKKMLDDLSAFVDTLDMPALLKFQKDVFDMVYHGRDEPEIDGSLCQSTRDYSEMIVVAPFLSEAIRWPRHEELGVFAGAYGHELLRTTLYDLYFGKEARDDEITPLQGALIYDFNYESYVPEQVGVWQNVEDRGALFGFWKKMEPKEGRVSPGHHLFHVTMSNNRLVCQNRNVHFAGQFDGELVCDFTLKEKGDIDFYLAYDAGECLHVGGEKATFFELGDRLTIMGLEIVFEKVSGEGRVCGHFLRGNRNGQTSPLVKSMWAAFDWQINLAVLEQVSEMKIRARIKGLSSKRCCAFS